MNNLLSLSEDKTLVRGLRRGEERAYRQLFEQYYGSLTIFALRYLNDKESAKELVQNVFLVLYRKREAIIIKQDQAIKAYLYKSVYHACLNERQQSQTRRRHEQQAAQAQATTDYTDTLVEAENVARIYQAIETLPTQCRRIFKLNRLEGLTNQTIATQLKLSKRTVETQISKALRLLRQQLLH